MLLPRKGKSKIGCRLGAPHHLHLLAMFNALGMLLEDRLHEEEKGERGEGA
ncbi:TPA: hypothetical protein QDB07_003591 [Burkholderia vietnamiensis]|nr:hypothetical protein [Burkholderia vietnamiensis]